MPCSKHGSTAEIGKSCCKCEDALKEESTSKCQPFFRSAIQQYEKRCQRLDERESLLHEKIGLMERSLPALMAMSMCRTGQVSNCKDKNPSANSALGQVRELMRCLSPDPDPADELAAELAAQAELLEHETAELHDRIIKAEVELEESCMELESLELANRELAEQEQQLDEIEPLTPADRRCLVKIKELGEKGARLERVVRELEERETALRFDIEKVVGCDPNTPTRRPCEAAFELKHRCHTSKSRKRKECVSTLGLQVEPTAESLFERDKICGKIHCDALNKMIEQKRPMTCGCQKKLKSNRRKTDANDKSGCVCQEHKQPRKSRCREHQHKRSEKPPCCHESPENRSQGRSTKCSDKMPNCPADQSIRNVCSSEMKTAYECPSDVASTQQKCTLPPCVQILVKTCECKPKSVKSDVKVQPNAAVVPEGLLQHAQIEMLERLMDNENYKDNSQDNSPNVANPWSTVDTPREDKALDSPMSRIASIHVHTEHLVSQTVSVIAESPKNSFDDDDDSENTDLLELQSRCETR